MARAVLNGDRSRKEFDGHGNSDYNEDSGECDIAMLDEGKEEDQDDDLDMELFGDG